MSEYGFNPYQPPSAPTQNQWANPQGQVSGGVIESLRKTRPWVLFLAILGFIGTGFMVLGTLGMLAAFSKMGMPMGFALLYLLAGAFALIPAVLLVRYSSAINRLMHGGGVAELEQAVDAQRVYWQTMGIMVIVGFVLYIVSIVWIMSVIDEVGRGMKF